MITGVLEIDELTKRAVEALPMIPVDYGHTDTIHEYIVAEFYGEIGNPIFVARYTAVILFGDLGMYRYGPVVDAIYPRDGGRELSGSPLQ